MLRHCDFIVVKCIRNNIISIIICYIHNSITRLIAIKRPIYLVYLYFFLKSQTNKNAKNKLYSTFNETETTFNQDKYDSDTWPRDRIRKTNHIKRNTL